MNVGTLTIEMAAGIARLEKDMNSARRTIDRTVGDISRSIDQLTSRIGGMFAGLTVAAFAGKLVSVQREFDILNSSLVTVTGSAAQAEKEFAWIKQFAAETPFGLQQATNAFIKMKAMGLEASEPALKSYANTASAMGKDLNQMIEAVADAATGEFERLKDFGIRASKEGDNVTFTFQNVATKVKMSSDEITDYLRKIGDVNFAGAVEKRAATLDGALSNLGDTWDGLFRAINDNSTGTIIADTVTLATGAVEHLTRIIQAMGTATGEASEKSGVFKSVQEGIKNVLETVALVGANVWYVLENMGRTMGAIVAVYKAVLSGNLEGAREIGRMYEEESESSRAALDAKQRAIFSAREATQAETKVVEENTVKKKANATVSKDAAKEAQKFAEKLLDLTKEIEYEDTGFAKDFSDNMNILRKGLDRGALSLERYIALSEKYIKSQKYYKDAEEASAKALEERNKEVQKAWEAQEKNRQSVEESIQQLEFEAAAISWTNEEREVAIKLRELEAKGIERGSAAWATYEARIRSAMSGRAMAEEAKKVREQEEKEWEKTWDSVADSFVDAMMEGTASTGELMKRYFKSLVLRPTMQALMAPVSAIMGGSSGGSGGGAGGGSGGLGGGNPFTDWTGLGARGADFLWESGAKAINGGWTELGGRMMDLGKTMGQFDTWLKDIPGFSGGIGSGIGYLGALVSLAQGNPAQAIGQAIGTYILPGIGTLIGGMLGGALSGLFGRKLKDLGIEGEFGGSTGFEGRTYEYYKGGLFRSNKTKYGELDEDLRLALATQFTNLKTGTAAMADILGLSAEALNGFTASIKVSFKDLTEEEIQAKLEEELTKLAETMADMVLTTDEYTRAGETTGEALVRLAGSLATVNGVFENLGMTLYQTGLAGADMASQLIDGFGGNENFTNALTSFYNNFFTVNERTAQSMQQMEEAFASLGYALPTTRKEYLALTESLDLTTEEGRKAWTTLIQLSGAFAELTVSTEVLAEKRFDIEQRILRALGRESEALANEREKEYAAIYSVNPELADRTRYLWELEDAEKARTEELQRQEDERQRQEDAAAAAVDAREKVYGRLENAMTLANEAIDLQIAALERQRTALQSQRQAAADSLTTINSVFSLLTSSSNDLLKSVKSTSSMLAAQGWVFIEDAIGRARQTGTLPDSTALSGAITAARSGLDIKNYTSRTELEYDTLVLAGKLDDLEAVTGKQKTSAEQTIERLDKQLEFLGLQTNALQEQKDTNQRTLEYWRRQLDIANGTFDATSRVADLLEELMAKTPGSTPAPSNASFGGGSGVAAPPSKGAKYSNLAFLGTSIAYTPVVDPAEIAELDRLSPIYHSYDGTGDLLGLFTAFDEAGGTLRNLSTLSGFFYNDWLRAAASVGYPAFDVGTDEIPHDMMAILHKGERVQPAKYNPALDNTPDESIEYLREIKENSTAMRGQMDQMNEKLSTIRDATNGRPEAPVPVRMTGKVTA